MQNLFYFPSLSLEVEMSMLVIKQSHGVNEYESSQLKNFQFRVTLTLIYGERGGFVCNTFLVDSFIFFPHRLNDGCLVIFSDR